MRLRSCLVVVLGLGLVAGCSSYFELHIEGTLASGIAFVITDADGRRIDVPLRELHVASEDGGTTLWHIKGQATVNRVVYGEPPEGLDVVQVPLELTPSQRYWVSANSGAWLAAPAGDAVRFEIEADGRARVVDHRSQQP